MKKEPLKKGPSKKDIRKQKPQPEKQVKKTDILTCLN
jgi:hypothetical protein